MKIPLLTLTYIGSIKNYSGFPEEDNAIIPATSVIIQKVVPASLWRISLEELYLSIMADLKKNLN